MTRTTTAQSVAKNTDSIRSRRALRYAIAGTLAVTLLAGCSGGGRIASASDRGSSSNAQFKSSARGALADAENAVAASPRVAALRVALGNAYLRAGRFQSAAASFNDAMDLGDNSGRTALSLALTYIANGRQSDAVGLLDDWRDVIPAADYGLALALAGESGRGVSVLAEGLRSGQATPKLRQNLAYAYALDGRWREARLMAEQDVPANQIDDRISQWAASAKPEDTQQRVAALLGIEIRPDGGQPQYLALSNTPSAEQLAAETTATTPQPEVAAVAAAPVEPTVEAPVPVPAVAVTPAPAVVSTPVVQPIPVAAAPAARPAGKTFNQAFASLTPERAATRAAPASRAAATPVRAPVAAARTTAVAGTAAGTHLVQLGAFSSQQGARRAWGIFAARSPELRGHRMTITQATVRGKRVWRVAAGGLDAGGASGLCSTMKNRGGACFAYAAPQSAVPGVPVRGLAGAQNARRR